MNKNYEVIIGIEIHAQLKTKSKMFCACAVEFGATPNTNVCPICLGMPGTLPTVNNKAVELAIKAGLALGCQIAEQSTFARKHYFYPDLPKGYQITQYKEPLATNGVLEIDNTKIRIRRLHIEEDSGKSIHPAPKRQGKEQRSNGAINAQCSMLNAHCFSGNESLIDFNRCGVGLIEVVTEPDLRSPEQAVEYLQALKQILNYLDVSDCDMEKGHYRCEPNISLRPAGQVKFGVRTELKNLNSLRSVREGLEFEIIRQSKILDNNGEIVQETLFWNEQTKTAGTMRSKEESEDYRYFPEPDLPVLVISKEKIGAIKATLPPLPKQRKIVLMDKLGLPENIADVIVESKEFADYFDRTLTYCKNTKLVANWLVTEVRAILNEKLISIQDFSITPDELANLLNLLELEKITGLAAKEIFAEMVTTKKTSQEIVNEKGLLLIDDDKLLNQLVNDALGENPDIVAKYKSGKTTVIGFLVGVVLKKSQGKLPPEKVKAAILQRLS